MQNLGETRSGRVLPLQFEQGGSKRAWKMEDKNRNFRSYYYEKVGFRAVEEKKSLEILFKESPIDKKKLTHFTLRFTVPNTYRKVIYSILLDVLPTIRQMWEFVEEQRKEVFDDLVYNLRLLQLYNPQLFTKSQIFVLMRALENGHLKLNYQKQLESHDSLIFMRICEALFCMASESEADLYWISKGFFDLVLSFRPFLKTLATYTDKVLLKEDEKLHQYLVDNDIWSKLPLETWYENALLALLPGIALQRVWDKLIGGSSIYMIFVMLCLLHKIRNSIFQLTSVQKLIECTKQLTDATFELVVNEAVALWQSYGSPLHPGSNTDCFRDHSKGLSSTAAKLTNLASN